MVTEKQHKKWKLILKLCRDAHAYRRKIPTLRCSNDFLNGTPMLSMSASSAYGSASDKSASCRRAGHLHAPGGLGAAGSAGLIACPEYGYTHICSAAPGPALLTRSCNHLYRRRSASSLEVLDAETDPVAGPYERPGVMVECRVDCRHVDRTAASGCGQPSSGLIPPPPPPLTAYCHDLDLVSTANDAADDSPSFNWPSISA